MEASSGQSSSRGAREDPSHDCIGRGEQTWPGGHRDGADLGGGGNYETEDRATTTTNRGPEQGEHYNEDAETGQTDVEGGNKDEGDTEQPVCTTRVPRGGQDHNLTTSTTPTCVWGQVKPTCTLWGKHSPCMDRAAGRRGWCLLSGGHLHWVEEEEKEEEEEEEEERERESSTHATQQGSDRALQPLTHTHTHTHSLTHSLTHSFTQTDAGWLEGFGSPQPTH